MTINANDISKLAQESGFTEAELAASQGELSFKLAFFANQVLRTQGVSQTPFAHVGVESVSEDYLLRKNATEFN